MIEVDNVCKRYRGHRAVTPLDGLSLTVAPGEVVMISGGSGAGKSTLLKLLYGGERADAGTVRVFGHDTKRLRRASLALLRRRIGIVPQHLGLLDDRSAFDNVALALQIRAISAGSVRVGAAEALAKLGLADAVDERAGRLSQGERQRVALARALVGEPQLLLLDEPTSHLSVGLTADLLNTIDELRPLEVTTVIATTDRQVLASGSRRGWNHFELRAGQLHPADLYQLQDDEVTQQPDISDRTTTPDLSDLEAMPNVVPFPLARAGGAE